jgi:phosphoglycerate dehydrogenase-like enzyme
MVDVVLHPLNEEGVPERLRAIPGVRLIAPPDDDGVAAAVRTAAVLVTRRWREDFLTPRLRWVQTLSAGYERFPLDALRARGVVLTSASDVHVVVAEHAIGLLLVLLRDIQGAIEDRAVRRPGPHVAEELGGRTVVVAGLGTIGEAVARRLAGWDVRLIGITRTPARYAGGLADVRPLEALAAACAEASVLFVTAPAAPQTYHLVSAGVLDALGPGWVVNVARGSLVDEEALTTRLRDGRLRGAGLDVTAVEPLPPTSLLWELPNVVCTPHMAGRTPRYPDRVAELLRGNLEAFHGTGRWRNRVC